MHKEMLRGKYLFFISRQKLMFVWFRFVIDLHVIRLVKPNLTARKCNNCENLYLLSIFFALKKNSHTCSGLCGEPCPPCSICFSGLKCSITLRTLCEFDQDEKVYALPECRCGKIKLIHDIHWVLIFFLCSLFGGST